MGNGGNRDISLLRIVETEGLTPSQAANTVGLDCGILDMGVVLDKVVTLVLEEVIHILLNTSCVDCCTIGWVS